MSNNVELIVIDKNFKRIKAIRAFSSLQWKERYYGIGEFELHCDKMYLNALFDGSYIFRKDKKYMGRIEYRQINNVNHEIVIKGRFLESILETRAINTMSIYNDTAENICRQMITDFCLTGDRNISHLSLGKYNGLGTLLSIQRTGKTVAGAIFEILNQQELSYRIEYDLPTEKMIFYVYSGLDRTQSQKINSWCVFSQSYYNILSEKYEVSDDIRNFAYVAGAGEGIDRIEITIDQTNGYERRELYVDARDLQQSEGMSIDAYKKVLNDRGLSKLAEYNIAESVECEIDINNTAYFELGDKCTYSQPEIGLIAEGRVTEIYEIIENNNTSINVTLGKEQLTVTQKIKRMG